jgi:hypothetical protein
MEMISGGVWGPVRRANIPTDEMRMRMRMRLSV